MKIMNSLLMVRHEKPEWCARAMCGSISSRLTPFRWSVRAICSVALTLACCLILTSASAAKDKDKSYGDWKPRIHFYDPPLWINDPNGPIYWNGQYHIFFQNNPSADQWGNMSWGHATSPDLLHWTRLPIALPTFFGVMNFSGSVVQDRDNSSGLCPNSNGGCLVAIFTGDSRSVQGQEIQNQNLAYSLDGGISWTRYAKNPVLDLAQKSFRDPKVFWHAPSQSWVMVVMLSDLHTMQIYRSKDLKRWKYASSFGPAGARTGAWECPDLMNLDVRDSHGNKAGSRWVLSVNLNPGGVAGGSGNQYFVGQFDGTRFVEDDPGFVIHWVDWGKDFYASTSFANIPEDQNRLWIAWMNNWSYVSETPALPGRGEMTIPRRIYLRQSESKEGAKSLVLVQEPVLPEVKSLQGTGRLSIADVNARFANGGPTSGVYLLRTMIEPGSAAEIGIRLRRNTLSPEESASEETVVSIDRTKGLLIVDRKHSGYVNFSPEFAARTSAPLKHPNAKSISIEIVVDRSSIEVFAEDGETVLTNLFFPSDSSLGLGVYANGAQIEGEQPGFRDLEVIPIE